MLCKPSRKHSQAGARASRSKRPWTALCAAQPLDRKARALPYQLPPSAGCQDLESFLGRPRTCDAGADCCARRRHGGLESSSQVERHAFNILSPARTRASNLHQQKSLHEQRSENQPLRWGGGELLELLLDLHALSKQTLDSVHPNKQRSVRAARAELDVRKACNMNPHRESC